METATERPEVSARGTLRCKAKSKRSGERCKSWAIKGLEVCRTHGGSSAKARQAGRRNVEAQRATRKLVAQATAVLAHEGIQTITDPLEELSRLTVGAQEFMRAAGARVNALNAIETYDDKGGQQLRVEVELFERAMDRTARLLDTLVKHGYTERQVRIAETEALLVAGVVKRTIAALGLTPEQQELAKVKLAEEFRKVRPVELRSNAG